MTVRDVLRCEPCSVLVRVEGVSFEWPKKTITGQCLRCERIVSDTRTEADYWGGVVLRFPSHAALHAISTGEGANG